MGDTEKIQANFVVSDNLKKAATKNGFDGELPTQEFVNSILNANPKVHNLGGRHNEEVKFNNGTVWGAAQVKDNKVIALEYTTKKADGTEKTITLDDIGEDDVENGQMGLLLIRERKKGADGKFVQTFARDISVGESTGE